MYKIEDITIFVGLDKEKNIKILPFIFNKKFNKIKILSNSKIFSTQVDCSVYSIIEKSHNLEMYDEFNLSTLALAETITHKELEDLTSLLCRFYSSESKLKNKPEKEINIEYRNF